MQVRLTRTLALATSISIVALASAGAAAAGSETQDERILSFDTDLEIQADGDLIVVERIEVRSGGHFIRHGIYRELPTRQADGVLAHVVHYQIRTAERDGRPERLHVDEHRDHLRLYLGDEDVLLPPGQHSYVLRYQVGREVRFFPDHDELYWNVTGNAWRFPIDQVSATVRVPPAAHHRIEGAEGYVGFEGARERAYRARIEGDRVVFEATRPLAAGEGITIVVVLPRGAVAEPPPAERWLRRARDNFGVVLALGGPLLLLAYFLVVASLVGRRPSGQGPGRVIAPPGGLSPAAMRLLVDASVDNRGFASALISLASKGALVIEEKPDVFTVVKTGPARIRPAPEEEALAVRLFADQGRVELQRASAPVRAAWDAYARTLRPQRKPWFVGRPYQLAGAIMAGLVGLICLAQPDVLGGFEGVAKGFGLLIFGGFNAIFFGIAAPTLANALVLAVTRPRERSTWGQVAGLLFFMAWFVGPVVGLGIAFGPRIAAVAAGLTAMSMVCGWFAMQWRPRSPLGWRLLAEVQAWKRHLSGPGSPARGEAELPYLMALDLDEDDRQQRLAAASGRASEAPRPSWYVGIRSRSGSSFGSSFISAVSSSSSSSSSGSSGGGSSGGGSGGGGGGGW